MIARLAGFLWGRAWFLLATTALLWSGNAIVGRALVGYVPPATLSFIRWLGAFVIVLGFAWPHLLRDRAVLLSHWRMMLLLSLTGIACFNVALYIGLNSTTALNGVLMQSSQPLIVILWAAMLGTERPTARRILGIVVSFMGVAVIVTRGSLGAFSTLEINRGDLWVLGGSMIYGLYIAILRWRPDVHPLSFLASTFGIGMLMVMPLMLNEQIRGLGISTAPLAWLGMLYIMIFPSLIAYLCFNRGVELAGPGTAGQATHLVPVFGTMLAILLLGERFHLFHAAGIALIAAGIVLATRHTKSRGS